MDEVIRNRLHVPLMNEKDICESCFNNTGMC